jgi:hypothetical protein
MENVELRIETGMDDRKDREMKGNGILVKTLTNSTLV